MNLLGLPIVSMRFRGKTHRLLAIYECFADHPGTALHPAQISRHTGIGFIDVNTHLERTPELFVRLPRRKDGLTRYRLTSVVSAQPRDQVEVYVKRCARTESLTLAAIGLIVLLVAVMAVVMVFPWTQFA